MEVTSLVDVIKQRIAIGPVRNREVESVAAILKRTTEVAIQEWYRLIQTAESVMSVPMARELRCAHLAGSFRTSCPVSCLQGQSVAETSFQSPPLSMVGTGVSWVIVHRCW